MPNSDMPSGQGNSLNLNDAIAVSAGRFSAGTITIIPARSMSVGSAQSVTVELTPDELRLIAAAPDLYKAILNSDDAHWTTAMRAAMAKVEGR